MVEEFIKEKIEKIKKRELDESIISFKDAKTKYIVPKNSVTVEVALTNGLIAVIDVTNFFKEDLK